MKKQLFLTALAVLGTCAVTSCSGNKALEDSEHTWTAMGNFLMNSKETVTKTDEESGEETEVEQYVSADWSGKDSTAMTAAKLKDVKALDETLAANLEGKTVKYLYTVDVRLGTNDAGWTTKAFDKDGKWIECNGSYAIKVAKDTVEVDEDGDKIYSQAQWIPDPHTAYAASLTPDTLFMPQWQEAADAYGFSWSSNPVCIGGAGVYTFVAAEFADVADGEPGYGLGLVKQEEVESTYGAYTELSAWIASEHTYGVIGSFAGSEWSTDVAMTANADETEWSAEVTLAAGDSLKVRADGDWSNSWGDSTTSDGNFKVTEAGTYVVTISNFSIGGTATVTVTAKAAE